MIDITESNRLGFGCMRLPTTDGVAFSPNVDISEFAKLADLFLERGYNYFDTSVAYHDGKSQRAVNEAVISRHPRGELKIATKFPTFNVKTEDQVDPFFEEQLRELGTDYVDFYLLHILMTQYIDGYDGKGGVVKKCRLFEHLKKFKEQGRAKHVGFSFHDSPDVLDKLLTENPFVEFVQIVVNYYDWDSLFIRSRENYEVVKKHRKRVIVMEPLKGGVLSQVPYEALELMRKFDKDATPTEWALRFAASFDDVFKILSGMHDYAQVNENTKFMRDVKPLTDAEREMLFEVAKIIKMTGPLKEWDYSKYAGIKYHGLPADMLLQAYNTGNLLLSQAFTADNNYLRQELLKIGVSDPKQAFPEEKVIFEGEDITPTLKKAWDFLVANMY